MCAGRDKLQSRLVSRFPAEEAGIKRYFAAIDRHQSRGGLYFGSKAVLGLLPGWLAGWLRPLLTRAYHEGSDRTVAEVSTAASCQSFSQGCAFSTCCVLWSDAGRAVPLGRQGTAGDPRLPVGASDSWPLPPIPLAASCAPMSLLLLAPATALTLIRLDPRPSAARAIPACPPTVPRGPSTAWSPTTTLKAPPTQPAALRSWRAGLSRRSVRSNAEFRLRNVVAKAIKN